MATLAADQGSARAVEERPVAMGESVIRGVVLPAELSAARAARRESHTAGTHASRRRDRHRMLYISACSHVAACSASLPAMALGT